MDAYSEFDGLIATRMHAAILALSAGVPALGISYEFKTEELFRRMGLGEWVTDIEEIAPESFTELVMRFTDALPSLRGKVAEEADRLLEETEAISRTIRRAVSDDVPD
jgi:colanic acid/amylovoran biosynthesis protein